MASSSVGCLTKIEVHLLDKSEFLVRTLHTRNLLNLHAIEIDHDARGLLDDGEVDVSALVWEDKF